MEGSHKRQVCGQWGKAHDNCHFPEQVNIILLQKLSKKKASEKESLRSGNTYVYLLFISFFHQASFFLKSDSILIMFIL